MIDSIEEVVVDAFRPEVDAALANVPDICAECKSPNLTLLYRFEVRNKDRPTVVIHAIRYRCGNCRAINIKSFGEW